MEIWNMRQQEVTSCYRGNLPHGLYVHGSRASLVTSRGDLAVLLVHSGVPHMFHSIGSRSLCLRLSLASKLLCGLIVSSVAFQNDRNVVFAGLEVVD